MGNQILRPSAPDPEYEARLIEQLREAISEEERAFYRKLGEDPIAWYRPLPAATGQRRGSISASPL